jgi:NADPH:quinone reductase-like Zn-dependent oxidoreductase
MASIPESHKAVASIAVRKPLVLIDSPTVPPQAGEIIVRVEWAASSPFDLHQADGGLAVVYPQVLGSCYAGTVVSTGPEPDLKGLTVGDKVFGFCWRSSTERAYQEYITAPAYLAGKIPPGVSMEAAVTVPTNLVTAFHALTQDLGLELPWPIPENWKSTVADTPILIWGAASSVGMYVIQVLRHWNYNNILAVASQKHHDALKELGAAACFDYRDSDVTNKILNYVASSNTTGPKIPLILDCIGHLEGTLEPLAKIAESGSTVAVMLPVIIRDATEEEAPEYTLDVHSTHQGKWADGVNLSGVRTHSYMQVSLLLYQPSL